MADAATGLDLQAQGGVIPLRPESLWTPGTAPGAPGSVAWHLERLDRQLVDRAQRIKTYDDYYEGQHRLAFATEKFRQAFGELFKAFSDNWCGLVVDAVEERLHVRGFRFGGSTEGDQAAWDIWQRNDLDAGSQQLHVESLISEEASAIVWADADGQPEITVEHPSQVVVAYASANPRRRTAALKRWDDDDGYVKATLFLPDALYKFQVPNRRGRYSAGSIRHIGAASWERREVPGEQWPLPNPLRSVPVVPFPNRPRLLKPGRSEIKDVIPVQDAVNKIVADMLVASEYSGFRKRWATGISIPTDPETGQPVEAFQKAIDRVWANPNPEGRYGDFAETDLGMFVTVVETLVQHIATMTRTPPHYFYLRGEVPSGESLRTAETGLTAKARRKATVWSDPYETVMRLSFAVLGDDRAGDHKAETIWQDPETKNPAVEADALAKQKELGIPDEILWEKAGYTPAEIERIKRIKAGEPEPVEPEPAEA